MMFYVQFGNISPQTSQNSSTHERAGTGIHNIITMWNIVSPFSESKNE